MSGQFPNPVEKRLAALIASMDRRLKQVEHKVNDSTDIGGVLNRQTLSSVQNPQANSPGWITNAATGEMDFWGVDGSSVSLIPGAGESLAVTNLLQGVYQAALQLSTPDSLQVDPAHLSSIIFNAGNSSQQMGTFWHTPYTSAYGGMAIGMISPSDDGTEPGAILFGTITAPTVGVEVVTPVALISSNAFIMYGTSGRIISQQITSSGTYSITGTPGTIKAEGWAAGGGGENGAFGNAGGAGEYSCEPALAVGATVAVTIGAGGNPGAYTSGGDSAGTAGGSTTIVGSSATVTAHGGQGGTAAGNAPGGYGSTNSIHHSGGSGGGRPHGSYGGGGGGSSGGPTANGNIGGNASGNTGGNGAKAVSGGGAGGRGGDAPLNANIGIGQVPGGGGGAGAFNQTTGACRAGQYGGNGRAQLTYVATAPAIQFSVASAAGTDIFGFSYPAGTQLPGAGDSQLYNTGSQEAYHAGGQVFNTSAASTVSGLTLNVGVGTYIYESLVQIAGDSATYLGYMWIAGTAVCSSFRCFLSVIGNAATPTVKVGTAIGVNNSPAMNFNLASGVQYLVQCRGKIVVTTAGTLTVAGSTSGGDGYTTGANGYLRVWPSV